MIARHCIYVDLTQLPFSYLNIIWIHTFVPGLPLSILDHNLINGNSLIGIASLDEIKSKFQEGEGTLR